MAFCEDFLRLLNHNQKGHKQKLPCLIGDANSGKTSLFQPLLGLIHHENIATITKQNESDPMPTQLKNDLTMLRQKEAEKEKESRELKAREAFDRAWLRRTEIELREETANKPESTTFRKSMQVLLEELQEKLKTHHTNLGTLGTKEALEKRKTDLHQIGASPRAACQSCSFYLQGPSVNRRTQGVLNIALAK